MEDKKTVRVRLTYRKWEMWNTQTFGIKLCAWFDITEAAYKKEKRWQRLSWGVRKSCNHSGATDETTLGNRKQSVSNIIIYTINIYTYTYIFYVEIMWKSHFHYFNFYLLYFFLHFVFFLLFSVYNVPFFCSLVLLSFEIGGSIRLYTEKLKSQAIISVLEENPLPIQYISFAGFENTEVQFFYNCSHINTSFKSVMGWFNAKIFKKIKFVIF